MEYGVNINTILPMRTEPSEKSEMISQLLFGEFFEVQERDGSFYRVKNYFDGYIGWVDKKMLTEISLSDYLGLSAQPLYRTFVPIAEVLCLTDKTVYHLSAGSFLPNFDPNTGRFRILGIDFQIPHSVVALSNKIISGIIPRSMSFINAPYLWGGKSIFGIDCSGFVQVVYSINGFELPRDARMQVMEGQGIPFDEIKPADLMFFGDNDDVTHVGIYLGKGQIIHASGKVKVSSVDSKGIYNKNKIEYTHKLTAIRRIQGTK